MDPQGFTKLPDYVMTQNLYEGLLWYNGTCGTCVIPWLAKSYTTSADQMTYTFTLREGITFQDGEPLNSTAVYFSLNRLLILDGSTQTTHGTQNSWIIQQLLNSSLSTSLSGHVMPYDSKFVDSVLGENFITVTGPYTFTIHLVHPSAAFSYLFVGEWSAIMAPTYVMQHDLAMWNQSGAGYSLPYAALRGSTMDKITQYFYDEVATCNAGVTPSGCGPTYLTSNPGLAGTGPYVLQSWDRATKTLVLKANPNYWGGAWPTKIVPQIQTIVIKEVTNEKTRIIDLQAAARSGQAMTVDVPGANLYDVASRNDWLSSQTLTSVIPGVTIKGPGEQLATLFWLFGSNVTNAYTGKLQTFQPTADLRIRLAFADSVNITALNQESNNGLGIVANGAFPPGFPPAGTYNASLTTPYSYNTTKVANLLLDAMMHPQTTFHFYNGTLAPAGYFDNTFGCATLGADNKCSNPVLRTIPIVTDSLIPLDVDTANQMAGVINGISAQYNMGLTMVVEATPSVNVPYSSLYVSDQGGWGEDYPWVLDFLSGILYPGGYYMTMMSWDLPTLTTLYQQALQADSSGNIPELVQVVNQMNYLGNQEMMYMYTITPEFVTVMTSNVQGFFFNTSMFNVASDGNGIEYFALLY